MTIRFKPILLLVIFSSACLNVHAAEKQSLKPIVKSEKGLCHKTNSSIFDSIDEYVTVSKQYDTYEECLADSGEISIRDFKDSALVGKYLADPNKTIEEKAKVSIEAKKETKNSTEFMGFNWNLAIGISSLNGGGTIDEVSIETVGEGENAIREIRVNKSGEFDAELVLEFHHYPFSWTYESSEEYSRTWAHGPFVTVGLAGEGKQPLDTFGIGWMFGTRLDGGDKSFNVGIGWYVDTEVQRLRPGLSDGMETMETDSTKLLQTVDDEGIILVVSFDF